MKKTVWRYLCCLIMVGFLVFVDQFTKVLAVENLKGNSEYKWIPGLLSFRYLENQGAAWGMLFGKQVLLTIVTILAMGVIVYVYIRAEYIYRERLISKGKIISLQIVLAVLFAGAMGNLIDRVKQQYVVDFLYVKFIDFPIFNIADCYVTMAVIALLFLIIFIFNEEDLLKFKRNGSSDIK